jgi:hypothetical protein
MFDKCRRAFRRKSLIRNARGARFPKTRSDNRNRQSCDGMRFPLNLTLTSR